MLEVPLNATALSGMVARRQAVGLPVLVAGGVNPRYGWCGGKWSRRRSSVRRSIMRAPPRKGDAGIEENSIFAPLKIRKNENKKV